MTGTAKMGMVGKPPTSVIGVGQSAAAKEAEAKLKKNVELKGATRVEGLENEPIHEVRTILKKLNMDVNTDIEEVKDNVRSAIRRGLPQIQSFGAQDKLAVIVAGGPSLKDTFLELEELYKQNHMIIAVNGVHDYLMDHGIRPAIHILVDARASNARFVGRPTDTCNYMLSSQCAPEVFDALEGRNVRLFHTCSEREEDILKEYYHGENYHIIYGGCTVTLRTLYLLKLLGFYRFDIFGWDSCYMDGEHHAYDMPENEDEEIQKLICLDKEFECSAWMASQVQDFQDFTGAVGDHFQINVRGEGLIAHMIRAGADADPSKLIRKSDMED